MRQERPLQRLRFSDGHIGWLVTGHEHARTVLSDKRFSVGTARSPVADPMKSPAVLDAIGPLTAGMFASMDPPEHGRLRRVVAEQFGRRRINERRRRVERIVGDRLDAMQQVGPPVDLVQSFALPVPSLAICDLLGVPHSDREQFEVPTAMVLDPAASPDRTAAAFRDFRDYAVGVIRHKRQHPADDLISDLIRADGLTDDEAAGMAMMLFVTGHETTAGMIALSTLTLLGDPDLWEALCTDPSSIEPAVEELLRYLTVVEGSFIRTALEDVQINGVVVREGESVLISLSAANRDPDRFPEPDTLDFSRHAKGHVAFGHGIHVCIGQHLARLELEVALAGLSHRFPTLHLAVPADDVILETSDVMVYHVRELPVAW